MSKGGTGKFLWHLDPGFWDGFKPVMSCVLLDFGDGNGSVVWQLAISGLKISQIGQVLL